MISQVHGPSGSPMLSAKSFRASQQIVHANHAARLLPFPSFKRLKPSTESWDLTKSTKFQHKAVNLKSNHGMQIAV